MKTIWKALGVAAIIMVIMVAMAAADAGARHLDTALCNGKHATGVGTRVSDNMDLRGAWHRDVVQLFRGDDKVRAARAADTLCGGRGDDKLFGGRGDDTLKGGPGNDTFQCGPGDDTAIIDEGDFPQPGRDSNCENVILDN